ncbi:hypothetical protein SLEP1_g40370 [Rubroshorea leprosula]|uniref:Uncharacterized protein n=1 Tax=Rubroshorea leprosula TaxID=152421 RepID=A0AAV5L3C8_9ROSI|nr:hypothetical protein SLEP1_g40370 [Rubroshorea leprosula]
MLQRGYSWSLFGKHGNGLEIVCTLSSRLMSSLPSYHIRLLRGLKLTELETWANWLESNISPLCPQHTSVNRSGLSPLPPEPVALNNGCDANHDISLAIVTRPSFKELKRKRRDIGHGS